jgi:hypothetical protein
VALVGVGLCLLVAELALYADRNVFDSERFADRATAALASDDVRALLAAQVTQALETAVPDAIAVRPLVEAVVDGAVGTGAFQGAFRGAAYDLHRSVFAKGASTVALTLADVGVLVIDALESLKPDLADQIPDSLEAELVAFSGGDVKALTDAARVASDVRWLALAGLLGALLLAVLSVAAADDRREAVAKLGVVLAVVGVLVVAAFAIAAPLVAHSIGGDGSQAAARDVIEAFLGDLRTWSLAMAGSGVILAASAASLIRPFDLSDTATVVFQRLAATPASRWRRALRALGLIALGAIVIAEQEAVLELVALGVGLSLLYVGVAEILRLWLPAEVPRFEVDEAEAVKPVPGHRRARVLRAAIAAGVALAALAAGGVALVATGEVAPPAPIEVCNGHAELCDRPIDQIALAATHNSMSAASEPGWLFANQRSGLTDQLEAGIRGLLIDMHYGFQTPKGVATDLSRDRTGRAKIADELGEDFVDTAERLRTRIGFEGDGKPEVFLCHAYCEMGAMRAVDGLREIRDFLIANPHEIGVISIEDEVTAEDTAATFAQSGLLELVWRGSVDPLPTPRVMIERGQRVLVMAENTDGSISWLHRQFEGLTQETPYSFESLEALDAPQSCAPNRGATASPLLLMNNWVETTPAPRPGNARTANSKERLLARAQRCSEARGQVPNLIAVDFFDEGDVLEVADALNSVGGAP